MCNEYNITIKVLYVLHIVYVHARFKIPNQQCCSKNLCNPKAHLLSLQNCTEKANYQLLLLLLLYMYVHVFLSNSTKKTNRSRQSNADYILHDLSVPCVFRLIRIALGNFFFFHCRVQN